MSKLSFAILIILMLLLAFVFDMSKFSVDYTTAQHDCPRFYNVRCPSLLPRHKGTPPVIVEASEEVGYFCRGGDELGCYNSNNNTIYVETLKDEKLLVHETCHWLCGSSHVLEIKND